MMQPPYMSYLVLYSIPSKNSGVSRVFFVKPSVASSNPSVLTTHYATGVVQLHLLLNMTVSLQLVGNQV